MVSTDNAAFDFKRARRVCKAYATTKKALKKNFHVVDDNAKDHKNVL